MIVIFRKQCFSLENLLSNKDQSSSPVLSNDTNLQVQMSNQTSDMINAQQAKKLQILGKNVNKMNLVGLKIIQFELRKTIYTWSS